MRLRPACTLGVIAKAVDSGGDRGKGRVFPLHDGCRDFPLCHPKGPHLRLRQERQRRFALAAAVVATTDVPALFPPRQKRQVVVESRHLEEDKGHGDLPDAEGELERHEATLQVLVFHTGRAHLTWIGPDKLVAAVHVGHDQGHPAPEDGLGRAIDESVLDEVEEAEDLVAVALETAPHHVVHLPVLRGTVAREARPVVRDLGGVRVARDLGLPVQAQVLLLAEVRVLVPAPLLAHAPDVVEHEPRDLSVLASSVLVVVDGRHLQ